MDGKQKSVAAITQELQNCSEEALIALCSNLRTAPRKCKGICRIFDKKQTDRRNTMDLPGVGKGKKGA